MEVSPAVEAVMERALSWSPRRRFESAVEFAEELEAATAAATRAEVASWVESTAATRLAVQRKLLSAMDAPYGRTSAPPPNARGFELKRSESVPPVRKSSVPPRKSSVPPPPPMKSLFGLRISAIGSSIAGAFRRSTPPDDGSGEQGGWMSGSVRRLKEGLVQQGSTVLATLSLVCLLLAATRATLSRAHPQAMQAGAAIGVLPAGNSSSAGPATGAGAEEACVATPSAPALPPEPAPHVATLVPGAPPPAAMSEPAPHQVADDRDRRRPTRPPPKPERGPCDPPFVIDESGIRRIKPNCL
jgi:serine/threonine-protein kinase